MYPDVMECLPTFCFFSDECGQIYHTWSICGVQYSVLMIFLVLRNQFEELKSLFLHSARVISPDGCKIHPTMDMRNSPKFQDHDDVFPIENVDFQCHVSFQGCKSPRLVGMSIAFCVSGWEQHGHVPLPFF